MKTLLNDQLNTAAKANTRTAGFLPFDNPIFALQPSASRPEPAAGPGIADAWQRSILNETAIAEIISGNIPDLRQVCYDLFHTFLHPGTPNATVQFIPVLKKLESIHPAAAERFMKNPVTRHVLVNNSMMKVVLIHWKPGEYSGIHGHPRGGCVFKVLQGCLEEKRYSPDESRELLSVSTFHSGSMAYIDDHMAYHAVGNTSDAPAISLHVYTPGAK